MACCHPYSILDEGRRGVASETKSYTGVCVSGSPVGKVSAGGAGSYVLTPHIAPLADLFTCSGSPVYYLAVPN